MIAAVAASVLASHLHPGVTPATATATGVATGLTGTAAAIDGPPLALLYQHDPPPVFRATLATQFALGSVFTLTALAARRGSSTDGRCCSACRSCPSYLAGLGLSLPHPATRSPRAEPAAHSVHDQALAGVAAMLRGIF